MAHFLRLMRCGDVLLLLRAAVAAKFCRVGEFLSAFATVDHGYFLMKEGAEEGARPAGARASVVRENGQRLFS